LIVAEKSEEKALRVGFSRSQRLRKANWKAQAARTREPRTQWRKRTRPERLTSEP